jgi:hypothetical protein
MIVSYCSKDMHNAGRQMAVELTLKYGVQVDFDWQGKGTTSTGGFLTRVYFIIIDDRFKGQEFETYHEAEDFITRALNLQAFQ